MWWKEKGATFKKGIRELCDDDDALQLANVAESMGCEMEIYLEHSVSSVANVDNVCVPLISDNPGTEKRELNVTENVEVNVGETVQVNEGEDVSLNDGEALQVNENTHGENTHDDVELNNQNLEENTDVEGAESDTSEDSMRGIHFDDSEEERVIDTDDGFRHDEVGEAEIELNERLKNMKRQAGSNINAGGSATGPNEGRWSRQRGEPSGSRQHGEPSVVGLVAPEVANMHAMEDEYDSEELLSGAENSDIEGDGKPRLEEKLTKEILTNKLKIAKGKTKQQQKRKTMTKSNNDTTKSTKIATQWKRGKKKSVPPGPTIPDFARNMSVGQLVTHLSRVWEEHRARVTALASAQSGEIPTQEEAHEAHPHSTLALEPQPAAPQGEDSLINDHNANVQNTDEVRGSTFTGQSSQNKSGTQG
ncbi:hypothetical protein SESBI_36120 [Sesbania bispinosa]|nr:hypothetical protein SESBI_36120 [Sesbania bispinosa]